MTVMSDSANPDPRAGSPKSHPMYGPIAQRLREAMGDTTLSMADDQDSHLIAFFVCDLLAAADAASPKYERVGWWHRHDNRFISHVVPGYANENGWEPVYRRLDPE